MSEVCAKCGYPVSMLGKKRENRVPREGGGFDHVACSYVCETLRHARGLAEREQQMAVRAAVRRGEVYR